MFCISLMHFKKIWEDIVRCLGFFEKECMYSFAILAYRLNREDAHAVICTKGAFTS